MKQCCYVLVALAVMTATVVPAEKKSHKPAAGQNGTGKEQSRVSKSDATDMPVVISDSSVGTRKGRGHKPTVAYPHLFILAISGWKNLATPTPEAKPVGSALNDLPRDPGYYALAEWAKGSTRHDVKYSKDSGELHVIIRFTENGVPAPHVIHVTTNAGADLTIKTAKPGYEFRTSTGDPNVLEYINHSTGLVVNGQISNVSCTGSDCNDTPTGPVAFGVNYK